MSTENVKTERASLKIRLRSCARSFARRMRSRFLAMISRKALNGLSGADPSDEAVQSQLTPMQAILAKRAGLEAQIKAAARCGLVSNGLAFALLNNFEDELAEKRRLLSEAEYQLQACLRKLDALSPKPEPQPSPQPRKRRFSKPSDWFPLGAPGLAK